MTLFEKQLTFWLNGFKKLVVMGIGNKDCCDDGTGSIIAEKILDFVSKEKISHVKVFPCYDFPENFTGSVKKEKPDHILLIDSSITGKKPGSIFILNPEGINHEDISSHRIPLRLLYEYLKKETRADIAIIGIEPYYIGKGNKCSKPVEKTINRIVKFLEQLLKNAKIKNEKQ